MERCCELAWVLMVEAFNLFFDCSNDFCLTLALLLEMETICLKPLAQVDHLFGGEVGNWVLEEDWVA